MSSDRDIAAGATGPTVARRPLLKAVSAAALPWLGLSALDLASTARAQTAPALSPTLRIETAMHEASTTDAAIDAAGKVLVTVSADKTARLWSVADLRPAGVLRPFIGEGDQGKLYCVAVSPDGRTVAVAGWTGTTGNQAIVLFDPTSKQVIHRIDGLPRAVVSLAFSREGHELAAGMGGAAGVGVWSTAGWTRVFSDSAYGDAVYGISFAPGGRLATASLDGVIRLYAADWKQQRRVKVDAGREPSRIAFSPDGALLAIGLSDVPAVEVRDGTSLVLRSRPNVVGLQGGGLSHVAWTGPGRTLLATGAFVGPSARPVFAWPADGAGPRRALHPGFSDATFAMLPLADGAIALMSGAGELAIQRATGQVAAEQHPVRQNLNTSIAAASPTRRLLLSADGMRAAWLPWGTQDRWLHFNAGETELTRLAVPPADMTAGSDNAGSVTAANWSSGAKPTFNGNPLELEQYEQSQSVAVARDQALLGTSWALRLFDTAGAQLWRQGVSSVAMRVNLAGNGRLAVAALGDGTIRWYRLRDGQELLALFVTADAARWVAFMPSGYYATSPGGEDLVGWHVNRRPDEAGDFFPVARFRERFYRPDVVARVLPTLDPDAALKAADAASGARSSPAPAVTQDLPPVINILAPKDGEQVTGDEAVVRYQLRSPSGGVVRAVQLFINGRPVEGARGLERNPGSEPGVGAKEVTGSVVIEVPRGKEIDVSLLARTDTKESVPARIRLRGARAPEVEAQVLPRLNAVLVGVSEYVEEGMRLRFAAKDAQDFADLLALQRDQGLYREVNLKVLRDAGATRTAVLRELGWLRRMTTSNDVAIVFLAGHGVLDEGKTFFLPVDADPEQLYATAVSQGDLRDNLARVPGRVVAFLDICHAGSAVLAQNQRALPDNTNIVNQLREPGSGLIVFASSTARQPSQELEEFRNGAFTAALLEGLRGSADFRKRKAVRTDELNVYVADRVRDMTRGKQAPVMQRPGDVPDFPIVVVNH